MFLVVCSILLILTSAALFYKATKDTPIESNFHRPHYGYGPPEGPPPPRTVQDPHRWEVPDMAHRALENNCNCNCKGESSE